MRFVRRGRRVRRCALRGRHRARTGRWYLALVGAEFREPPGDPDRRRFTWSTASIPPTRDLPEVWMRTDEWYDFMANPRPWDTSTSSRPWTSRATRAERWGRITRSRGAASTTAGAPGTPALGHTRESWTEPLFLEHLLGGIAFAAGWPDCPASARRRARSHRAPLPGVTSTTRRIGGARRRHPRPGAARPRRHRARDGAPGRGALGARTPSPGSRSRGGIPAGSTPAVSTSTRACPARRRRPLLDYRFAGFLEADGRGDRDRRTGGAHRPLVDGLLGTAVPRRDAAPGRDVSRRRRGGSCSATTSRTTRADALRKFLARGAFLAADGFVVHAAADRDAPRAPRARAVRPSSSPHPAAVSPRPLEPRRRPAGRSGFRTEPLVLFLGLVRRYKGVDLLLDAAPAIVRRHAGDDRDRGRGLSGRARPAAAARTPSPVRDRILWKDAYVPEEEMALWLAACDVVVLPYRAISGSGIAARAFAAGRPVAAAAVGGLRRPSSPASRASSLPPGDCRRPSRARSRPCSRAATTLRAGSRARGRARLLAPLRRRPAGVHRGSPLPLASRPASELRLAAHLPDILRLP